MNKRVKQIRKELGLIQTEFGARLGVSGPAITLIEQGKRALTDQMAKAICREFGIDPNWLHTGEGEPFLNRDNDMDNVIDALFVDEKETAKAVFKALAKMGGDEWRMLKNLILSAAREIEESEKAKE